MALAEHLQAILEAPDDDAPRLAYAAQLRDQGDEAEATRIERAVHAAARYVALGEGALERAQMRYQAAFPFSSQCKPGVRTLQWGAERGLSGMWEVNSRRGFVESAVVASVSGDDMERVGALEPLVALSLRGPSFDRADRAPSALLAWQWMSRLQHLALHEFSAKDDVVGALVQSPHWVSLKRLHLASCKVDNARAKELCDARLPALRHLELFDNPLRAAGLKHLITRFAGTLETLSIDGHRAIDETWGTLFAGAHFPTLKRLVLGGQGRGFVFPDALVKALAQSPTLPALEEISLRGGQLSALSRQYLDARFPLFLLEDLVVDATEGLRVSGVLRSTWDVPRTLQPPSLLERGMCSIVGLRFALDGVPRNNFDLFTVAPRASHHISLHVAPEFVADIPRGQLSFSTAARPVYFEHARK